ncbi:MAG: hypothetical protein V1906_03300 [Candidatus Woesearchaeota archaeon]
MRKGPMFAASIVIALIGLLFIGKGLITGMYSFDLNMQACNEDSDCNSLACCKYYNADYGVCTKIDNCKAVYDVTREESSKMSALNTPEKAISQNYFSAVKAHMESPAKENLYDSLLVGITLLLIAVVAYMLPVPEKKKFKTKFR